MLRNAFSVVDEPGRVGPSTHKLIQELMQWIGQMTGVDLTQAAWGVAAAVMGLVIWLSYNAYLTLRQGSTEEKARQILFLVCLVYALIHPRFKDYAYLLLIVPTYHVIKNARHLAVFPLLFILAVMASPHWVLPLWDNLSTILWKYYPLMVVFCVWGLNLHEISARAAVSRGTHSG